jgi:hypothetical protein
MDKAPGYRLTFREGRQADITIVTADGIKHLPIERLLRKENTPRRIADIIRTALLSNTSGTEETSTGIASGTKTTSPFTLSSSPDL